MKVSNSFSEYDEIDNDTLSIFESWATETYVRQFVDGHYQNTEEKIYDAVTKEGDWIEDLIESHNSALEIIKKMKKSQETIEKNHNRSDGHASGQSSRAGFDEDDTFKWMKSRSRTGAKT